MDNINVFVSVGATSNDGQESFVTAIEHRLKSEGLIPNTIGRNTFSADAPLKTIIEVMNNCAGTIIIAFERTYYPEGFERRNGAQERKLNDVKYTTAWNQIEAALAYSRGQPIMVIMEDGIRNEGLLEKGYDWYVMNVKPDTSSLATNEFNGVLASWKEKVKKFSSDKTLRKLVDTTSLTIIELILGLKPAALWSILVALIGLATGSFSLGLYVAKLQSPQKTEDVAVNKKSPHSPVEQKHIDQIALLNTTAIGNYSFEEVWRLLYGVDKDYFGSSSFLEYRDSLNSPKGTKLKWYDSGNNEYEVFRPEFKNKLLSLGLIQSIGNNHYTLTENGKSFFIVDDKIRIHTSIRWDIQNQRITDSIQNAEKAQPIK